jgi:hypothetical protein
MELKGCPMKKLLALFVILTVAADAAEYKWIGGENGSWQSDKSFEPNGNPGGEDDVLLPANVVVKLNETSLEKICNKLESINYIEKVIPSDLNHKSDYITLGLKFNENIPRGVK